MGIKIHNNSSLDIWTSMTGPLQWNNNTKSGETIELDPGWVWVTLNAKVNSGSDGEIDAGKAVLGNMLPILGFLASPAVGILVMEALKRAQAGGTFKTDVLPEKARLYVDAGAVVIDNADALNSVDVGGVYGKDNDVDVWGGDIKSMTIDGGEPQDGGKLHIEFNSLQIRER